ncbi:hypothetical protein PFUGPA_01736 [Plasmodium falciparum Palo Alto/Uganda]|uniref:Holocytochrome c-type synthase n=1 Tax=Plasmodium falciparum (isolate Palo Alto / Uganda) TaxID=57270 RepID=W4J3X6_PLAFP|nr:hypothetical protein PFUGPA_01736 [Plasmodium falciparum Palo Alto/Uganda]
MNEQKKENINIKNISNHNNSDGKEKSSIPSKNGSWYYPSQKQFYNTTKKKGRINKNILISCNINYKNKIYMPQKYI